MIPYADSPFDHENVGEEVYFHILNHAKKYVHIMTPYLILDNEMIDALTRAAKGGIEVQIIMHIFRISRMHFILRRLIMR